MKDETFLRNEQGCVVANHPTLIDYVLLASGARNRLSGEKCTTKNPFLGGVSGPQII